MKTIRRFVVCIAFSALLASVFAADPNSAVGPAVPLPPYHVNEFMSYFGFAWKATMKDDKIQRLRFSRVDRDSLASNAGVMLDDRLLAIDGHSVDGMTFEELQQAFYRPLKPGATAVWKFTIERGGLFPKPREVTLQIRTAPEPKPESPATPAATEPTKAG